MFNDEQYVVLLSNGKYFSYSLKGETDDLKDAAKYALNWQPAKDMYLLLHLDGTDLTYELRKIKTTYELID